MAGGRAPGRPFAIGKADAGAAEDMDAAALTLQPRGEVEVSPPRTPAWGQSRIMQQKCSMGAMPAPSMLNMVAHDLSVAHPE